MGDYFKEDGYYLITKKIYIWNISVENYFKEVMLDGSIFFHGGRILCEYI